MAIEKFVAAFSGMVDLYDKALSVGMNADEVFGLAYSGMVDRGLAPLQAASRVRCVMAVVAKRHGHDLYSPDELARLVTAATSGPTAGPPAPGFN